MKKILVMLLILIFMVGSTCYAKDASKIFYVDNGTIALDSTHHPIELCDKHRHCDRHKHDKKHHKKHHKHKDHDDNDLGEIIAGIIIYEVVKDALD